MLDTLFGLPAAAQFGLLALYGGAVFGVGAGLQQWLHRKHRHDAKLLPVAPSYQAIGMIYALLVGFLATDIWIQQRQAVDASFKEELALTRLHTLIDADPPGAAQLRADLDRYQAAVAHVEWGRDFNRRADPVATEALRALRGAASRLAAAGAPPLPVVGEWLRAVNELEDARQRRLLIGVDETDDSQWTVVLGLAFFVAAALGAVHMDRPRAGRLVLAIFCSAMVIVLWQLARHTDPYQGGDLSIHLPAMYGH